MQPSFFSVSFPLFGRKRVIPVVSVNSSTAIGRSGGQGRLVCGGERVGAATTTSRRGSASPWTGARPMAGWARERRLCVALVAVVAVVSTVMSIAGYAEDIGSSAPNAVQLQPDASFADIEDAARQFDLPPDLIRAVIAAESHGDASAVSPKGALGLLQLMPETYREMQRTFGLGTDPFDVHDNIIAGTAYLRMMLDRFGRDGFLAAYQTGPKRFEHYLASGTPLPRETLDYLARLEPVTEALQLDEYAQNSFVVPSWSASPLFVTLSSDQKLAVDGVTTSSSYAKPEAYMSPLRSGANALFPDLRIDQ